MQTKFTLAVFIILISSFIFPLNTLAQKQRPNKEKDRITQIKPVDKTPPREREPIVKPPEKKPGFTDVKKERPPERPPNPLFQPRKDEIKPPVTDNNNYPDPVEQTEVYVEETVYFDGPYIPYDPSGTIIDYPENIVINYKLEGIQKYKDEDYYTALNYFSIAIEEDTNDYELYYHRGLVELKIKFFEEAKDDFTKYLEYFFYEPDGYFQLGLAKFYLNEKAEAKIDFQVAADMGHKLAISILRRYY